VKGLAVLAIGLTIRLIVSFFAVAGLGFNLKEHIFITLAWMPKATVQVVFCSSYSHIDIFYITIVCQLGMSLSD